MTEVEEPRYNTLAERIAALNQQKNFDAPPPGKFKKPPPPPPPGKPAASRPPPPPIPENGGQLTRSPTVPVVPTRPCAGPRNGDDRPPLPIRRTTVAAEPQAEPPALPGRKLPPALPTRRPGAQTSNVLPPPQPTSSRRPSSESVRSTVSTRSSYSMKTPSISSAGSADPLAFRNLPPPLKDATLPKLPPTRRELEAQAAKEAEANGVPPVLPPSTRSAPTVPQIISNRPGLPPRLPSRPARPGSTQAEEQAPALPTRRLPPPPSNGYRSKPALDQGFGGLKKPQHSDDKPPPVPLASRPTMEQMDLLSRRPPPVPEPDDCLVCRDFTGPDTVAAQHPITHLPRFNIAPYLAQVLCDPFPSKTDKARAIFSWCHHNIAYDVENFFGGTIPRGQTVDESILSGKGVCEGYARVYESIARAAGLECYLVSGHGKGFGHVALKPGEALPAMDSNHAWNVVRIDGGEWKLIDACWGAGHLSCNGRNEYTKKFAAECFYMTNEEFGLKHYPDDDRHFYRQDGRVLPWPEYIAGTEEPVAMTSTAGEEGISASSVSPAGKKIRVHSGETVRFQLGQWCPHWIHGKSGNKQLPFVLFIKIHGVDGRKEDYVPLKREGYWWYADIPARDLGAPGQDVICMTVDTFKGQSGRGISAADFMNGKGRVQMSFMYIATWNLV